MLRVILLQKAYNPGYTYLRNGKIVRVEAFSDRRVKRAVATGKRDDRTGDLFGDAGPTIDKPLQELIDDHEKVIDALESPSKAKRQAAADEQKEHLEGYRRQLDAAGKDGLRPVATTSTKTATEGYEYRDLTEPKVLFRAVSPEEWAQIQRDGEIRGGLNTFNGFDPRREVFFGDALNDELIAQGEDVARRAEYAIQQSDLQKRYQRLQAQLGDLNAQYEARRAELIEDGYTSAGAGMHPSMQAISKKRRALQESLDEVQAKARKQIQQIVVSKWAEDEARGYSSVVLETRPVSGGRIYSGRHSNMPGDEYGFDSGAVKLADVVRVHYVKDRKVLRTEDWPRRPDPTLGIDWLLPPEQETQRAGLMLRVRQLTDAPQPKTAFDRRQQARDLAASKKALKKMPEGMLTEAGAIVLRGADNLADSRLLQIYLEGVGIAFEGAKDVEEAWKAYEAMWASSGGPPISRRYFEHVAPRYGLAPPKLSARGMKARAVLQVGGYFRKQLETQYRGGEKFETRLYDASGQVVPGIGYKTWAELSDAGLLASRPVPRSTAWPSEWGLREKPLAKSFPRVLSVRQVVRMS